MIHITVDEAYAFDMLAILFVKTQAIGDDKAAISDLAHSYGRMSQEIASQIGGKTRFDEIHASREYQNLLTANRAVFNLIDEIKTRPANRQDGLAVDSLNYQRYLAKKILQARFFGGELSEQKIGYR